MPLPNLGVLRIVHDAMHTHTHTHTDPTAFKKPEASDASDASSRLEDLLTDDEILHIAKIVMKYYDLFDPAMIRDLPLINKRMRTLLIKEVEALKLKHYIFTLRGKLNDAQKQLFRPGSQSWDFSGLQSPADITLIGTIIHLLDPGDKPSELILRDMPYSQQSGSNTEQIGFNTEQIEALINVITDGHLKSLKFLDISGNKINTKTLQNLANAISGGMLQSLKHLNLGSCYISYGESGMGLFFDALKDQKDKPTLPSLENLILNNNQIDRAGMLAFATAVKAGALKSLKHLNLGSCYITFGESGMGLFVDALKDEKGEPTLPSLENLILNNNQIDHAGMLAFATAIKAGALASLKHLELGSTNPRSNDVMTALAGAITAGALQSLEHLNLSENFIDDTGMLAFATAIKSRALMSLKQLNLADNPIYTVGLQAFTEVVQQLPSLERLIITNNNHLVYNTIKNMLTEKRPNIELI